MAPRAVCQEAQAPTAAPMVAAGRHRKRERTEVAHNVIHALVGHGKPAEEGHQVPLTLSEELFEHALGLEAHNIIAFAQRDRVGKKPGLAWINKRKRIRAHG